MVAKLPSLLLLFLGLFFCLFALLLLHAPWYEQYFYGPILLKRLRDNRYALWPDWKKEPDVEEAQCKRCPNNENCFSFARSKSPDSITYPGLTCNPTSTNTDDATCINEGVPAACDAYCSLTSYPSQGVCVNGTSNNCNRNNNDGSYNRVCEMDPLYVNKKGNPYLYYGTNPTTENAKAAAIMNYWVGPTPSDYNSFDFWMLFRWTIPVYLLLILPYINPWAHGAWQMLAAVVGVFFAFVNTIQSFLFVWILTARIATVVTPPEYDLVDRSYEYVGAQLVVAGTYFMFFAQLIFFVVGIWWMKSRNSDESGYAPVPAPLAVAAEKLPLLAENVHIEEGEGMSHQWRNPNNNPQVPTKNSTSSD